MARTIGLAFSLGLAAIAFALTGPLPARADTYRVPATGTPALAVDSPSDEWNVEVNPQAAIVLAAKDGGALLQLVLLSDPKLAAMTDPDIAAEWFKSLSAPPPARSEPDSIGGARGQAFIGATTVKGVAWDVRLILVRLDATRIAMLLETVRAPRTPAQTAALDDLVKRMSLIR